MEAAAEGEDELLEKYLGGEELTADEVIRGFHKVVRDAVAAYRSGDGTQGN